jgi:hypothetical protein
MTLATVGSAPRHSSLLPLPTAAEVVTLQGIQDYPAVSVLCTAEPAATMSSGTARRLGHLVAEARERLAPSSVPTAPPTWPASRTR